MVLEAQGLTKSFGETRALTDVSFSLAQGESLALLGPNGAGKTTTLRILATLLKPDQGSFKVLGRSDPYQVRRLIGYMPDVLGIYPEMQVKEYLEFFARAYQLGNTQRRERIEAMVAFAGLEGWLERPLEGMSRGQLQRVALARALLHDPLLLLLDEPAAGLDPRSRLEFRRLLQELRQRGKTVVISSHVLSDLEDTSSHIAVIEQGALLCLEPMHDFLEKTAAHATYRLSLVGDLQPAMDFLKRHPRVHAVRLEGGEVLVELTRVDGLARDLLRELVEQKLEVEGFAEVTLSLEQAYLARTRDLAAVR